MKIVSRIHENRFESGCNNLETARNYLILLPIDSRLWHNNLETIVQWFRDYGYVISKYRIQLAKYFGFKIPIYEES